MKIAIHHRSKSFSEGWIEYCKEQSIDYELVNAYDNNIIERLKTFDFFFWHHNHSNYRDKILAKKLVTALENTKVIVFPNAKTCWHFDDKVAQKYLFESIGAPFVNSYAFYDKKDAIHWASETTYPKVFKLTGGAGSSNVRLVKNKRECLKLIKKSFGAGFKHTNYKGLIIDNFKRFLQGNSSIKNVLKYIALYLFPSHFDLHLLHREKGYIYFQDFIPDNQCDTRIVVVGDKIIGERRGVRPGDFRASGSNSLFPDVSKVDINCVKIANSVAIRLGLQVAVFDFVHLNGKPLIVEVSFGTDPDYTECEGYWDSSFDFHKGNIDLSKMIISEIIK